MIEIPRTFVLTVNRQLACFDETVAHLDAMGVKWERFNGMDNRACRLTPMDTFDVDRVGERIATKHICATLTHYMLWKVMLYQPDDMFLSLEYDVRLVPNFRERYAKVMEDLPDDWQLCFFGHCCCQGRETKHIKGEIYEIKYPLCGHGLLLRKSALPTLLDEHQKISMPLDIAMFHGSLPKLRVYCVVPALIVQHNTYLSP